MVRFFESEQTKEFLNALKEDIESHSAKLHYADFQPFKEINGRNTKNGRTKDQVWMHPYLFIKFAMWINPKFELQVIKFVYDQLIKTRHLAGDNYNVLTSALATIPYVEYKQVATAIQWIVFNKTGKDLRQSATQKELQEISEIEHSIAFSINMGFIKDFVGLMNVLREMYNKKYRKF